MRRWLPLALLAACTGGDPVPFGGSPQRPVDLAVTLGPREVPLLGAAELVVDLFAADGDLPELQPQWPEGIHAETGARQQRPWHGGTWLRQRFTLRPTRLGEHRIPALVVTRDGARAQGEELLLTATTLLATAGPELEAPAPPFAPAFDPISLWPGPALLAIAALAWWALRRLRARRGQQAPAIALPPHVTALRELARLRAMPRITPDQIERFHVEVSAILRSYIEQRFGLHAPERTTEEFLLEAEQDQQPFGEPVTGEVTRLTPEQRGSLRAFLEQCDLVKFARHLPGAADQEATFAAAEQFVEATRPDRAAPAKGAA